MSCYGSNIKISGTEYLSCSGFKSCAETILEVSDRLWIAGYLGAENAIINAVGTSVADGGDMHVYIGAFMIGTLDGTEIICNVNTSCIIDCFDYACSNIKSIECDNCTSIEFVCTYAVKSIYCPDGTYCLLLLI